MAEVASLENCKRLYELSGWGQAFSGDEVHVYYNSIKTPYLVYRSQNIRSAMHTPAYSAGYLLRKLPTSVDFNEVPHQFRLERRLATDEWWASYSHINDVQSFADTPEDALCLLAIKLFEEKILK